MITKTLSHISVPVAEFFLSRSILSKVADLKKEGLEVQQNRSIWYQKNLYQTLAYANSNVPYYRDLFKKIGFNPELVLKDLKYFEDIPLLTKEILREEQDRMISQEFQTQNLYQRKTNGSTGLTTSIFYSREALDWSSAANLFIQEFIGKKLSEKETYIISKNIISSNWKELFLEQAKCLALNRNNIFYDTLDEDSLDSMARFLKRGKTKLVLSTPSVMYSLCHYINSNPYLKVSLENLICTGEVLDSTKRKYIESTLNCQVYNRYGNAEIGVIAQDGQYGNLKVIEQMCYPENLPGSSELVITNLKNKAMPLIRYRTGDEALVERNETGYFLKDLRGRIGDTLYINGTQTPTEFVKDTLFRIADIEDFQILKCRKMGYTINIVCAPDKQPLVRESVKNIWSNQFKINFTSMDKLLRVGTRNKFTYLIDETRTSI